MLPKALVRNGGYLNQAEGRSISELLHSWFAGDPRFAGTAQLLVLLRFPPTRLLFRGITSVYKMTRGMQRKMGLS